MVERLIEGSILGIVALIGICLIVHSNALNILLDFRHKTSYVFSFATKSGR